MASSSNTAGQFSSVTTSFKWKLDAQLLNSNGVVYSPEFHANNSRWRMELYPRGTTRASEDYVSLFLRYLTTTEDNITATMTLSVVNNKNMRCACLETPDSVFKPNGDLGYHNFVKRNIIFDPVHRVLTSDKKVTLMCEIISSPNNQPQVLINLESLFNNAKFSDVMFNVGDRILFAHKNILANKSSVFTAMFEHNMKENIENVVVINDIDYNVVLEMLRFIYTGKVNNVHTIAQQLLIAADKYELPDLKAICGESLCCSLSIVNSLEYLDFAHRHGVKTLELKAIEFIVTNVKSMIDLPGFNAILKLPEELILKFIRGLVFEKPDDVVPCIIIGD